MGRVLLKNDVTLCREDGSKVTFHIEKKIGSGASCVVYQAICDDKTEHLLKEYYPRNLELERSEEGTIIVPSRKQEDFDAGLLRFREGAERQKNIRLLEDAKNATSNIQGYLYGNGTEYIDMTVFSGCTYDRVQNETLYDMMRRMRALTQIVGYYHEMGILHLDIKPQNIYAIPETPEMVMMFDFDSATEKKNVLLAPSMSYTKDWAAPEQLLPYKRSSICEAADLFSIGEIIFTKIFGRHSTQAERRSFAEYDIDYNADIFKNVNPKVVPLIKELFRHTLCAVPSRRYQTASELIEQLDKIIALSDPQKTFIKKGTLSLAGFFTGRDAEIQAIHEKFKETDTIFLSGIGGIGKSELAKHYAKKYEREYDAIIFAPFVNDIQMMISDDNYVPLYNFSQYPEENPNEYFVRKMRKLGELCDNRVLIIVDNLDVTDDENIDKLFTIGCKMLVTTRADFSDVYSKSQMDIDVLADPFTVFNEYYKKPLSVEERKYVNEIVEIVCGHTMTVELLAKQMMAGRVKPEIMLENLKSGGISESGKEKVFHVNEKGEIFRQNTYAHIQALFNLSKLEEKEKYVLVNLSLIPYTGVPTQLFFEWCEIDDYDVINNLSMEGWIRWDKKKDYISLHSLIAEIILDNISNESDFELFLKNFISHLRKRDISEEKELHIHCENNNISKHILALIQRYNFSSQVFGRLACDIGGNLYLVHQLNEALNACEISVFLAQKHLNDIDNSDNRLSLAQSLSQKALVQCEIGNECCDVDIIRNSIEIYLKTIELFEEIPDDHPIGKFDEIATLYSYAGMAYEDLGEVENAREMYLNGIETYGFIKKLDEDAYQGIGCLYNHLGNTHSGDAALKYYLLAKENHEKVGTMTRHLAMTMYHLADIYSNNYYENVDFNIALEYARKVLIFFEEEYLEDLYMIGKVKYLLAKIYLKNSETKNISAILELLSNAKKLLLGYLNEQSDIIKDICELILLLENDITNNDLGV